MTEIGSASIPPLEKKLVPIGLMLCFVTTLVISLTSSGTYDAGDSVMHYEIARWAFAHPEHFLSHWGKPFFTLVASPFAQLGFGGIKLFQCLLALGCGWMLWRSAHRLSLRPAWLSPLLALAAIEYFLAQTSGLTEPLFAFTLFLGVFLFLHDRPVLAAIALSLLPFVRTEGFLLLPLFGIYLLVKRDWKSIPFLAAGTVVYMLVGGIVKGNFLWIWTENPYSGDDVPYGVGGIFHFPQQYLFVAGIPIYILTILGFLLLPMLWLRRNTVAKRDLLLLVVLPFAGYFGMHVFFWTTGIGHSMGMKRVLIGIIPLGALIALFGLQQALDFLPHKLPWIRKSLLGLVIAYVLLFPILPNPASIHAKDLQLSEDQRMVAAAVDWIKEHGLSARTMCWAHPSMPYFLGTDPFQAGLYIPMLYLARTPLPAGTLVLHDSWFGPVEAGTPRSYFDERPNEYRLLQSWEGEEENTAIVMVLYEKI